MNKAGTTQTKNLFVQSEIKVFIFWAKIDMIYEEGKSTSTQEGNVALLRVNGS